MFLINVQSLRNKTDALYVLLEYCNLPSLVLITEHWLKETETCHVPNYSIISKYSRINSIHGGTMILLNRDVDKNLQFIGISKYDHLIVEKEFEFSIVYNKLNRIYIFCIYRTPSSNPSTFVERLEVLLTQVPMDSKLIVAGDFNINFDDKDLAVTQSINNLFLSLDIVMHVSSPTRVSQFTESKIDYMCSNFNTEQLNCEVIPAGLSDHEAITLSITLDSSSHSNKFRLGRIFSRKNFNKFYVECNSYNWNFVSNNKLIDFYNTLVKMFNKIFPLKKLKIRKKKNWVTKGIKTSSKNMRCLHTIRKYTTDRGFNQYFLKYKKVYGLVIKAAKLKYYNARLAVTNRNRANWNVINELRGHPAKANIINSDIHANTFNQYYCSIGRKLTEKIAQDQDPISFLNLNTSENLVLSDTNVLEVIDVVREIGRRNRNASGLDSMSVRIIENLPVTVLDSFVQCINECFQVGHFPECLKTALVIPISKGSDIDSPTNFRPISLLPTVSKIIEKIVKKRIMAHLNKHNLLSSNQFGFQQSRGTGDAMFSFFENIYSGLNDHDIVAAVFCDYSKAFDCVNHEILLRKLQCYGFNGKCLDWMTSYLSDRLQMVNFNGEISHPSQIPCGVPQGSVLGPILFLLYINDLTSLQIDGRFTIFADDTTIVWHGKNEQELRNTISHDLAKIKSWCDSNLLLFNVSKTNILTFKFNFDNLFISEVHIENRVDTKFLGLHIDSKLKFVNHVNILNQRVSRGCYAVRVVSNELGIVAAKTAYFAFIESHLTYGLAFWGYCSQQLFNSTFILQKRAMRYICKVRPREHCRPLFLKHGILTLPCLFIVETVVLIHKKYFGLAAEGLHNTRQSHNLLLPIPKTTLTKNSVLYESKKIYNHLPLLIRATQPLKSFKKKVRNLLVTKAYYSLQEYYQDRF